MQFSAADVEALVGEISHLRRTPSQGTGQASILDWDKPALDRLANTLIVELARLKGEVAGTGGDDASIHVPRLS